MSGLATFLTRQPDIVDRVANRGMNCSEKYLFKAGTLCGNKKRKCRLAAKLYVSSLYTSFTDCNDHDFKRSVVAQWFTLKIFMTFYHIAKISDKST